jgi:hypothetical protein
MIPTQYGSLIHVTREKVLAMVSLFYSSSVGFSAYLNTKDMWVSTEKNECPTHLVLEI